MDTANHLRWTYLIIHQQWKINMETPEELANQHWSYVEKVLQTAGENPEIIEKIKMHYIESFKHGFKHGRESYGRELNGENI